MNEERRRRARARRLRVVVRRIWAKKAGTRSVASYAC
jgi:hypothetical protein